MRITNAIKNTFASQTIQMGVGILPLYSLRRPVAGVITMHLLLLDVAFSYPVRDSPHHPFIHA